MGLQVVPVSYSSSSKSNSSHRSSFFTPEALAERLLSGLNSSQEDARSQVQKYQVLQGNSNRTTTISLLEHMCCSLFAVVFLCFLSLLFFS